MPDCGRSARQARQSPAPRSRRLPRQALRLLADPRARARAARGQLSQIGLPVQAFAAPETLPDAGSGFLGPREGWARYETENAGPVWDENTGPGRDENTGPGRDENTGPGRDENASPVRGESADPFTNATAVHLG
jgi:hypothetical protein